MSAMSERLSMRKVREVLRLKFECRRSHAEIAASVAIGESTVGDYLARARAAGLRWEQARSLSDAEVEARLFRDGGRNEPPSRVPIDFAWVHRELSKPAVTLQTLWVEYRDGAMGQAPLKLGHCSTDGDLERSFVLYEEGPRLQCANFARW